MSSNRDIKNASIEIALTTNRAMLVIAAQSCPVGFTGRADCVPATESPRAASTAGSCELKPRMNAAGRVIIAAARKMNVQRLKVRLMNELSGMLGYLLEEQMFSCDAARHATMKVT